MRFLVNLIIMTLILVCFAVSAIPARGATEETRTVPIFRGRFGLFSLTANAGQVVASEPIGALVTVQPTLLWDLPTFKSRVGIHFLSDFNSTFGLMPISGAGISGYFYLFGVSSTHEIRMDGTLVQKSRPGPFVVGSLTPVNFNMNQEAEKRPNKQVLSFSALVIEFSAGAGWDFPLRDNLVLSLEAVYRYGGAQQSTLNTTIDYSGFGAMVVVSSSYY